jgi:hypothetical protein
MSAWDELVVLNASSGEVVYHALYNAGDLLPDDAPLLGWGTDFFTGFSGEQRWAGSLR